MKGSEILRTHIDNIMDDLISKYSEDDIRNAYASAVKRSVDNKRKNEITDKRSKVLGALTEYFIAVFGKADMDLVKEFENELITIEGKVAESPDEPKYTVKKIKIDDVTDDEKLRKFIDEVFKL